MKNSIHPKLFEVVRASAPDDIGASVLDDRTTFQSRAARAGADFKDIALQFITQAGGAIEKVDFAVDGFPVDALVRGRNGRWFLVLARGTPDQQPRAGLRRTDTVEKLGFVAVQLSRYQDLPILLVTSDLPKRSSKAGHYLASLSPFVWDVCGYRGDLEGYHRLRSSLNGRDPPLPLAAPWRRSLQSEQPTLID